MKILLTGAIQSFSDKKSVVVLDVARKTKEGPVGETFYLKFQTDDAYNEFKSRYAIGSGVQVIGLLRQIQSPLLDRASKQPLLMANGKEMRNTLLAVEVKEHKALQRDETDTIYAHGLVGLVEKKELRKSGSGLSYIHLRVAYNHYKRADEEQGQADFYNLVAFGGQAESLEGLEKGDKFLIDHGVLSLAPYEVRDVAHSDGTPISRNSPEITCREFSFLPRAQRAPDGVVARAGEEIPF